MDFGKSLSAAESLIQRDGINRGRGDSAGMEEEPEMGSREAVKPQLLKNALFSSGFWGLTEDLAERSGTSAESLETRHRRTHRERVDAGGPIGGHLQSIVFLLDDSKIHSADFSEPRLGNPAVGGTEFNFVSLAHELATRRLARIMLVHRNRTNTYPKTLSVVAIDDYPGGLRKLLNQTASIDCIVVRGHDSLPSSGVMNSIPQGIPVIAWTHNHLRSSTLSYLAACEQIKRIVYVGREQCALAAGAPCYYKSTYIANGIHVPPSPKVSKHRRAVYVGHLVPEKGFHRLARLWPRIRRACPTAELDVIGSSRAYQPNEQMGALGVASRSYENLILRYLRNDPAKYGVIFHGMMGIEKYGVMSRAMVGLPNPTGFTECCPGSVLEMSGCQAAIVAMRQWGMCDTVVDQVSGFLCRDDSEYVDRVVSLFANPDMAQSMGVAGQRFVSDRFSYAVVCEEWVQLFNEVPSSTVPNYSISSFTGTYPLRKLRAANSRLHSPRLHALVSFVDRVRGVFLKRY
jgi:glycosyltransferase involved in cell wall biosynthesis